MHKSFLNPVNIFIAVAILIAGSNFSYAYTLPDVNPTQAILKQTDKRPLLTPKPPQIKVRSYILIDANSGKVLAAHNINDKKPPASLTKMMTMYLVSSALASGRIKLDDKVRISKRAWRAGGSRMFVKAGQLVPVRDLIHGVIVASGNDACTALAEHIAGSEEAFTSLMNQQAAALGMTNSNFTDATGLPHANHYSTARDMAILTRAMIKNFPDEYRWYKDKWFKFNGIRQPNRNRLLWRNPAVDGVKTGHTNEAGYCLVASAKKNKMRLISVVMGAKTDEARAEESQRLLTYGFRFFETPRLYAAGQDLGKQRIWNGKDKVVPIGVQQDVYVTIPNGEYKNLKAIMELSKFVKAPVTKGQLLGNIIVQLRDKELAKIPLIALKADPQGGLWTRLTDGITLTMKRWLSKDKKSDS